MEKKGMPFEKAVRDVAALMDPGAKVTQGEWLDGPDGRRDSDVIFDGTVAGTRFKGIIECKDYDRSKIGRVGVKIVEELDSKRRDFDFNFACICSNAGFTKVAMAKARRIGIGLIGVMREGDARIAKDIEDFAYTRRINIKNLTIWLFVGDDLIPLDGVANRALLYEKRSVAGWVCKEIHKVIAVNSVVNGTFRVDYAFTRPLTIECQDRSIAATRLSAEWTLSGAWFRHKATLTAASAVYDWVRRRAVMAPGKWSYSVTYDNTAGGKKVKVPHPTELEAVNPPGAGLRPILINGPKYEEADAEIGGLVRQEDLDLWMRELPPSCFESSKDFKWSWNGWTIRN